MIIGNNIIELVADTYTSEEILSILDIDEHELVRILEDEILKTIWNTRKFGEAERLNESISETWFPEDEEDAF